MQAVDFYPMRVAGHLSRAEPLITLPVALMALLRFTDIDVALFRARGGEKVWHFRFSPGALLKVSDDGVWRWQCAPAKWRATIEPYIRRAEAIVAA
jgi:hypothetical protein